MAVVLRLARAGRKKRPFYRIVAADKRAPRDGRYIEKVGTYNPLLNNDNENRVTMVTERVQYWLDQGAQPSERVALFLGKAGMIAMPKQPNRPNKAKPGEKQEQLRADKAEKQAAAKEAAAEAKKQAAEDAKAAAEAAKAEAEAPKADDAPAADAEVKADAAADAPAEDAKAE